MMPHNFCGGRVTNRAQLQTRLQHISKELRIEYSCIICIHEFSLKVNLYEISDNSIDEHMAGRCDHIQVKIHSDGSVSIADDGSGIMPRRMLLV